MSGDSWKRRSMARWLSGRGIELGALNNPLRLPAEVEVRYVDREPTEALRRHYPDLDYMVPVSIIGDAHELTALGSDTEDFVVANHVIEHLEDPIRGLQEIARVTRPGGLIFLAVPDQRATVDRHRPVTPLVHIVDEYHHGTVGTRRAHFEEYVEQAEGGTDPLKPLDARQIADRVDALLAIDGSIHFHVFRPDTFLDLLCAARREAGIVLELVAFAGCDGGADDEFIFVLAKGVDTYPRATPSLVMGKHLPPVPEPGRAELVAMLRRRSLARLRRALLGSSR